MSRKKQGTNTTKHLLELAGIDPLFAGAGVVAGAFLSGEPLWGVMIAAAAFVLLIRLMDHLKREILRMQG